MFSALKVWVDVIIQFVRKTHIDMVLPSMFSFTNNISYIIQMKLSMLTNQQPYLERMSLPQNFCPYSPCSSVRSIFKNVERFLFFLIFLHVSKSQYFFSNSNSYCFNSLHTRNLQEQVKNHIIFPKIILNFHCLNRFF